MAEPTARSLVPTLNFLHQVAESGTWTPELVAQGAFNVDAGPP